MCDLTENSQHLIPGSVTKSVVDGLETVQIRHDYRKSKPMASRPQNFNGCPIDKRLPVQRPGQGIESCLLLKCCLENLAFGYVVKAHNKEPNRILGRQAINLRPKNVAVSGDELHIHRNVVRA